MLPTWARRSAIGLDLTRPGENDDHECTGYYSTTETGADEVILVRQHVWSPTKFIRVAGQHGRDQRGAAFEPLLITSLEATHDALSIRGIGKALLNYPRLCRQGSRYWMRARAC